LMQIEPDRTDLFPEKYFPVSCRSVILSSMTCRADIKFSVLFFMLAMSVSIPLSIGAADPAASPCVKWTQEARFAGFAYNHLIHLTNNCDYTASCRIKTDVNPKEETVLLAPKESKTHLTFRGSPSREFKAEVSCIKN
jgi:hypothetical protein